MIKPIMKNITRGILLGVILNVAIDGFSLVNVAEGIGFGILVGLLGAYIEIQKNNSAIKMSL